jgi:hypothetical protein
MPRISGDYDWFVTYSPDMGGGMQMVIGPFMDKNAAIAYIDTVVDFKWRYDYEQMIKPESFNQPKRDN